MSPRRYILNLLLTVEIKSALGRKFKKYLTLKALSRRIQQC